MVSISGKTSGKTRRPAVDLRVGGLDSGRQFSFAGRMGRTDIL